MFFAQRTTAFPKQGKGRSSSAVRFSIRPWSSPPRKTHFDPSKGAVQVSLLDTKNNGYLPNSERWRTVRDLIGDLPSPVGTEIRNEDPPFDLHFGRSPTPMSLARYKAIPKEGMNRFDLQKKAPEMTPACSVPEEVRRHRPLREALVEQAGFYHQDRVLQAREGRYLHPEQHRPITHREAARLQSFPDDFIFMGSKIEIAKQIGNAVPPLLAARVADVVYMLLSMNRS